MSISNDEIYAALLDVKQDIGGLLATMTSHQESFKSHVVDDKRMAEDISKIELRQAAQRGSIRTWGIVATGVATIISTIGAFWKHT